jgi:hypothetical protein
VAQVMPVLTPIHLFPPLAQIWSPEKILSLHHRVLRIIFIIDKFLMHGHLLQTKYFLQFLTKNWHELYVHRLDGLPG